MEFLADGTPYPVEYKHGTRNKKAEIAACDDLQLALTGGFSPQGYRAAREFPLRTAFELREG